jgi:hypothetical protein
MASQPPNTQDDDFDDTLPEDPAAGSHPETDDEPPLEAEDLETPPEDEPPSPEDDAESEEWKSLEKKFENIEDPAERRRAIGKQYWEKTRYASQVRKEKEDLEHQLEEARTRRAEEARHEPPEESPPHPDLERLDSRITALNEKNGRLFEQQQKVLLGVSEVDQGIAVIKDDTPSNSVLRISKPGSCRFTIGFPI